LSYLNIIHPYNFYCYKPFKAKSVYAYITVVCNYAIKEDKY